jgi:hypothetical protein
MAKNSEHNKSAAELTEEIERSRQRLGRNFTRLRDELDIPKRLRKSFNRQPAVWIATAVVLGLVLTAISTRKKTIQIDTKKGRRSKNQLLEAGFLLGTLKVAATLFKPVIVPFLQEKVRQFSGRGSSNRS